MGHSILERGAVQNPPWNAGRVIGAKRPLKPRDVWTIRFYLDQHSRLRNRALFDLALDSKLRGCEVVRLKIGDLFSAGNISNRATVIQQKTGKPVKFELGKDVREDLMAWRGCRGVSSAIMLFQAASITAAIWAPAKLPAWWMSGSAPSVSMFTSTAPIR